jgi:hypothetical protein
MIFKNSKTFEFQHLRSRRLELIVRAQGRADLDRDLFLNLGRVQNFSLDVSRDQFYQTFYVLNLLIFMLVNRPWQASAA